MRTTTTIAALTLLLSGASACPANPCGWTLYPDEYLGEDRHIIDAFGLADVGGCAEASVEDDTVITIDGPGSFSFRVMANESLRTSDLGPYVSEDFICQSFIVDRGNNCIDVGYTCEGDTVPEDDFLEVARVTTNDTNIRVMNVQFTF